MIELFLLDSSSLRVPEPDRTLAAPDLARLDRMSTKRRREFLFGRALLNAALADRGFRRRLNDGMIDVPIGGGKPSIPGVEFNLSHDGAAVLLGLGDQPIGVDIETVQVFDDLMLEMCFTPDERRAILTAPRPDRAATLAWCMKEASAKALGSSVLARLGRYDTLALPSRFGFVTVAGRERAYAVVSTRRLPDLTLIPALPRFDAAFQ